MQVSYNIAATLDEQANRKPYQKAVVFPVKHQSNGRISYEHLSYQQLATQSDEIARALAAWGIQEQSRCLLMVKPSIEFFVLTFALFKVGAVPVFIDPGLGLKNIKSCIRESEPEVFIGIAKAHLARRILGWGKKSLKKKLLVGSSWSLKTKRLENLLEEFRNQADHEKPALPTSIPEDPAAMVFTSGSTGAPKGALYTHGNFRAQIDALRNLYKIQPGEIDLCTFPLFALFAPALGMTSIIPEMNFTKPGEVNPERLYEAIENFGVTNMFGSPALLKRFSEHASLRSRSFPSIKRIVTAGAPVPFQTIATARPLLHEAAGIYTPYGATESLPVANIESDEILRDTHLKTMAGKGICVGKAVDQVDLRIIKISDDAIETIDGIEELSEGAIGEIIVKGPQVTRSYWQRPEATKLAKIKVPGSPDFYHRMGDVGYKDKQGRLWYCGRKTHRVVLENTVLFSIPCEAIFNQHRDVKRSALVGVEKHQKKQAYICIETEQPMKKADQERIRHQLKELAGQHDHTQQIAGFLFHPEFPVDIRHNSKIFREKLARWAQGQLS